MIEGSYCAAMGARCDGRIQLHHLVPQQRIKREHKAAVAAYRRGGPKPWALGRMLADERNLVPLCKRHHELVEQHLLEIDVPAEAWLFAAELDRLCGPAGSVPFTAFLESRYGQREAA